MDKWIYCKLIWQILNTILTGYTVERLSFTVYLCRLDSDSVLDTVNIACHHSERTAFSGAYIQILSFVVKSLESFFQFKKFILKWNYNKIIVKQTNNKPSIFY